MLGLAAAVVANKMGLAAAGGGSGGRDQSQISAAERSADHDSAQVAVV